MRFHLQTKIFSITLMDIHAITSQSQLAEWGKRLHFNVNLLFLSVFCCFYKLPNSNLTSSFESEEKGKKVMQKKFIDTWDKLTNVMRGREIWKVVIRLSIRSSSWRGVFPVFCILLIDNKWKTLNEWGKHVLSYVHTNSNLLCEWSWSMRCYLSTITLSYTWMWINPED